MFFDDLIEKIRNKNCACVVGLDTDYESIPDDFKEFFPTDENGVLICILEFNKRIINAVKDIVPAVKLQVAFYEVYGSKGMDVFFETARFAHQNGLYVIADVKRGDIGSTAEVYSKAYLRKEHINAITVNPYMGFDTLEPFIKDCERYGKEIFVLVKTSNKGSKDIQDLKVEGKFLYEVVAKELNRLGMGYAGKNGYSFIGGVVGATYPDELSKIRRIMYNNFLLIPGYGAQGGTAEDVKYAFNPDGLGAIINSSRGIIYAYKKENHKGKPFYQASRDEVISMRDTVNDAVKGFLMEVQR